MSEYSELELIMRQNHIPEQCTRPYCQMDWRCYWRTLPKWKALETNQKGE